VFVAEADDSASFFCDTDPSLPYEPMRIGSFEFDAPNWFADEAASAACSTELDCPIA
jgi:hypothetical protein